MARPRLLVTDFALESPAYAGSTVYVYAVGDDDEVTDVLLPLYANPAGVTRLGNPQTLTSRGQWPQPVYVEAAFSLSVKPHVGRLTSFEDEGEEEEE